MTADIDHLFPVPPARVLEVVAAAYGMVVEDLAGIARTRPAPEARRAAYRLLYEESWLSWASITSLLGRLPGSESQVARQARQADAEAVDVLRGRLRVNGNQEALW